MNIRVPCALMLFAMLGGFQVAQAQTTYYFDVNGATLGSGVTNGGSYTWTTGTNWSTSAIGDVATTAGVWSSTGNHAVFVANSDAGANAFTVTLAPAGAQTWVRTLTVNSGNPTIAVNGGNFVLGATSTWTVPTSSTLSVTGVGNGTWGALNMNGNSLTVAGDGNSVIAGMGNGGGSLTKNGNGTLTLAGPNTYTGGTTVSAGTLNNGTTTTNASIVGNYSVASGATLRFQYNAGGVTGGPTFSNVTGAGTLALATAKSFDFGWGAPNLTAGFTGTLQIEGGRVALGAGPSGGLGGTSNIVVTNGGQLALYNFGNNTLSQNLTIAGTGYGEGGYESAIRLANAGQTTTLSGTINLSASATLAATGSSTLTNVISGAAGSNLSFGTNNQRGTITLGGASSNTYTGTTILNAGNLQLGKTGGAVAVNGNMIMAASGSRAILSATQDNQFGPNTVMSFPSAAGRDTRFELKGTTQTLAGLDSVGFAGTYAAIQHNEFSPNAAVDSSSHLILDVGGANSYTFGNTANTAVIRNYNGGVLSLTKQGTGTQTLLGAGITYTGQTTVTGGRLVFSQTSALNTSIANSATVEINSVSGDDWTLSNNVLSGAGTWIKTGAGRATFSNTTVNATGQFLIQAGTLRNNNNLANWSNSTADIDISAGAILDLYADAVYVDQLTGTGFVQNNYGNSSGQSGSSAFYEKLVVGVANGTSTFNGVIRNNSAGNAPAAGTAGGGIQLEKTGTGSFTVTGNNTYSGGTTLSQGVLRTTSTTGFGTGTVTLGSATTGANNIQLTLAANNIANNIVVSNDGTGTATIYGETQYQSHTGAITLNRATILQIPNTGTGDWWYSFGGAGISGAGPLTIKGGGGGTTAAAAGNRVLLSGNNSYTGGTTIESGQLQLGHVSAAGTGDIVLGNANTGTSVTQLRLGSNIANKIIVSAAAPNSAAGIATYNGLQTLSGGLQVDRALTIYGAGDRLTWSGPNAIWSGSGDITISGGRVTHDTAVNTWSGNLTINAASTFQMGNPGSAIANASSVTANGALRLALSPNGSATIPLLNGGSSGTVFANSGGAGAGIRTLNVGAGNGNGAFAGTIGPGTAGGEVLALTKIGNGTQVLSGANTYAGVTNVSAGELIVDGTHTGAGNYFVASGARLGGDGTINLAPGGSISIAGTPGELSPGNKGSMPAVTMPSGSRAASFSYSAGLDPQTVGTLNVHGDVDMDGYLLIDLVSPTNYDLLNVAGDFIIDSGALLEINGETDFTQLDFAALGFAMNDRVDLVTAENIFGNFSNVNANQGFTDAGGNSIFFGNDGSSIFLQVVPEPTGIAIWTIVGLAFGITFWLRRNAQWFLILK